MKKMNSDSSRARVIVACGGTGGHIFPGLAVAEELQAAGVETMILLAGKSIEKTALSEWSGPVETIRTKSFSRRNLPANLSTIASMYKAWRESKRLIRSFAPRVLLAMGSYASVSPVLAAYSLRVPVVIHEANVIPGRANRLLARFATAFAMGFAETAAYLKHPNMFETGIPLRKHASQKTDEQISSLANAKFTFLVVGGSSGANVFNNIVPEALAVLWKKGRKIQVIHLSGPVAEEAVRHKYAQITESATVVIRGFLHNMPAAYQKADLAICRAGAATCAELANFAVPALLVPYPYAVSDHQTLNARVLEKSGLADLLPETDLTALKLANYIENQMDNPLKLKKMREAALPLARPAAAKQLADLILSQTLCC